jgi:hypothetical protein
MPDNDNTDSVIEQPWLDIEDWEIALHPYHGNPDAALTLSTNLAILQSHIAEPGMINEAVEEINRALEVLFLLSPFPDITYTLFRRFVAGEMSAEEQDMLKKLGVKL